MKHHIALITALAAIAAPAMATPISFTLEGVEAYEGTLYVGVQTEDQFEKQEGVAGKIVEAPTAGVHTFSFDLPPGVYSISVWHDINGDNTFNMDEQGIPTDGWAAINGANLRARPTFDQVSFTVAADKIELRESVIY